MTRARRRLPNPLGLTLLEMLVTLVIVSMIGAILAQALQQLARIERHMEAGQLGTVTASLHAEWVRSAWEALMPGGPDEIRFRGDERAMMGLSSQVPLPGAQGVALLNLRLVFDETRGETRLEMLPPAGVEAASAPPSAPIALLRWPGREGRFRYLSRQGEWLDQWPAPGLVAGAALGPSLAASAATLPMAVMLETSADRPGTLVAAPKGSAPLAISRRAIEGM